MAVELVFETRNNFSDKYRPEFGPVAVGICTAFSLLWAKWSLQLGKGLKERADIHEDDLTIQVIHAANRRDDQNVLGYLGKLGLTSAEAGGIQWFETPGFVDLTEHVKATAPHVAIFWNNHHTMGYRYKSHEKEFFDCEHGLYRAEKTADIIAQMKKTFQDGGYKPILACHVVTLPT